MAEPSDAIPPELREAFHTAVAEYHSWRPGEDEPEVSLDRRSAKISDICNRVMDYNSMPQFALLSIPMFVIMFLLSGSFTPFESMPAFLQSLMYISPSTHFVRFGQAVLYRGAGIGVSRFRTMLAWQS